MDADQSFGLSQVWLLSSLERTSEGIAGFCLVRTPPHTPAVASLVVQCLVQRHDGRFRLVRHQTGGLFGGRR